MINNVLYGLPYSTLMYGLPYTSNIFTRSSNKGVRKFRGWSSPQYSQNTSLDNYIPKSKNRLVDSSQNSNYASALSPMAGDVSSVYNQEWGANALKAAGLNTLKSGAISASAAALAGLPVSSIVEYGMAGMANPASAAAALGNAAAAGMGVDVSGGAQKLSSILGAAAGSLLGPVGTIIGGVVAPFAADALMDVTNLRSYETVRDIAEDLGGTYSGGRTLGTGVAEELKNAKKTKTLNYAEPGQLAVDVVNTAVANSNVQSRPGNTFDPITGPQALARATLQEMAKRNEAAPHTMQGWEVQARINEAMKLKDALPSLVSTRNTYSPFSIKAQARSVQGPAGQTISKALDSLAMSQTALTNPSFNSALTTTRQAVEAMGFSPKSFSQPEMVDISTDSFSSGADGSSSSGWSSRDSAIASVGFDSTGRVTGGWGGGNRDSGGRGGLGGRDSAIGSVGFDSGGHMTGGWSGGRDFGLGSSLGGIGSSLGSDAIGGSGGWSGVGGRGGDSDSMNGPW